MTGFRKSINATKEDRLKGLLYDGLFFENGFSTELVNYECNLPSQFQIPVILVCAYRQIDLDCLADKDQKKSIECHNHTIICE
jgi:hypothetical protein